MGTITLTQTEISSDPINNRIDLIPVFAGAQPADVQETSYNPETEEFTVPGLTDQEIQDAVDDFANLYDIWFAVNGPTLEDVKTAAHVRIDRMAGQARSLVITIAPGQELTYQEKSEEAADYVAAGYPVDTSDYPFIQAEIEATGKTKEEAADDILTKKSEWIAIGSTIEKHRIGGKSQVDAATTPEEVQTIVDGIAALLAGALPE